MLDRTYIGDHGVGFKIEYRKTRDDEVEFCDEHGEGLRYTPVRPAGPGWHVASTFFNNKTWWRRIVLVLP